MAKTKTHPERVNPGMARQALTKCKLRNEAYTQYIIIHFRSTGKLAPGCDARDLYAWYDQNMPAEIEALTKK